MQNEIEIEYVATDREINPFFMITGDRHYHFDSKHGFTHKVVEEDFRQKITNTPVSWRIVKKETVTPTPTGGLTQEVKVNVPEQENIIPPVDSPVRSKKRVSRGTE